MLASVVSGEFPALAPSDAATGAAAPLVHAAYERARAYAFPVWAAVRRMHFPCGPPFGVCISRVGRQSAYAFPVWAAVRRMHFSCGPPFGICISRVGRHSAYAFLVWAAIRHMHFPCGPSFDMCISRVHFPCGPPFDICARCMRPVTERVRICISRMGAPLDICISQCAGMSRGVSRRARPMRTAACERGAAVWRAAALVGDAATCVSARRPWGLFAAYGLVVSCVCTLSVSSVLCSLESASVSVFVSICVPVSSFAYLYFVSGGLRARVCGCRYQGGPYSAPPADATGGMYKA